MDHLSLGGLVAVMATLKVNLQGLTSLSKDIAVLLPTRGRGKLAERSLLSLIDKAKDLSRIEFQIALDEDDHETIEYFKSVVVPNFKKLNINFDIIGVEPLGYIRLHEYVNLLAKRASANWLMFWNDDALMETDHWDEKIAEHNGKFRVLRMQEQSQHPYAIFPIVPIDWLCLLGHLSDHQMSDAQISQIAYMCDIMVNLDVHCTHDRFDLTGNNNDETYNNRPQLEGNPENPNDLNSVETVTSRFDQATKIMWYLRKIGDSNDHFRLAVTNEGPMWDKLEENDPEGRTSQFNLNEKYVREKK